MQHTFLYISLPSLHDCDVKFPQVTFRGGRKHRLDYKFLFLPLNLVAVPKNSIPGKFTYIRLRFYTSRKNRDQHLSLLNSDVFATVAVVVDKAPYYGAVKNLPSGDSICTKMRFRCGFHRWRVDGRSNWRKTLRFHVPWARVKIPFVQLPDFILFLNPVLTINYKP